MKATEQHFPVVLFVMLYKVVLTLCLWKKSLSVITQMRALKFHALLCVPLLNVPNRKNILMSKWQLIQNQPLLREIYKEPPIISYKKRKIFRGYTRES